MSLYCIFHTCLWLHCNLLTYMLLLWELFVSKSMYATCKCIVSLSVAREINQLPPPPMPFFPRSIPDSAVGNAERLIASDSNKNWINDIQSTIKSKTGTWFKPARLTSSTGSRRFTEGTYDLDLPSSWWLMKSSCFEKVI